MVLVVVVGVGVWVVGMLAGRCGSGSSSGRRALAQEGQVGGQGEGGARTPQLVVVGGRGWRSQTGLHVPGGWWDHGGEDRSGRGQTAGRRRSVMLLLLLLLLLMVVVVVVMMSRRRCRCRRRRRRRLVKLREGGGVDVDRRQAVVGRGRGRWEESAWVTHCGEERRCQRPPYRHVGRALRVLGTLPLLPKEPVLLLVKVRL